MAAITNKKLPTKYQMSDHHEWQRMQSGLVPRFGRGRLGIDKCWYGFERFKQRFLWMLLGNVAAKQTSLFNCDTAKFCEIQELHHIRVAGSDEGKEMLDLEANSRAGLSIDSKPNTWREPAAHAWSFRDHGIELNKEFIALAIVADDGVRWRICAKRFFKPAARLLFHDADHLTFSVGSISFTANAVRTSPTSSPSWF
jgi:hypothetical protein